MRVPRVTAPGLNNRRRLLGMGLAFAAAPWASQAQVPSLPAPAGPVVLKLVGKVKTLNAESQAGFDMAMLEALRQQTLVTQTPWYSEPRSFTGPLLRDVLAACGAQGERLRLTALNDFRAEMPIDDTRKHDVIVARLLDGKAMTVREKGPLFIMYPFSAKAELRNAVFYSRSVWQLHTIEVL